MTLTTADAKFETLEYHASQRLELDRIANSETVAMREDLFGGESAPSSTISADALRRAFTPAAP